MSVQIKLIDPMKCEVNKSRFESIEDMVIIVALSTHVKVCQYTNFIPLPTSGIMLVDYQIKDDGTTCLTTEVAFAIRDSHGDDDTTQELFDVLRDTVKRICDNYAFKPGFCDPSIPHKVLILWNKDIKHISIFHIKQKTITLTDLLEGVSWDLLRNETIVGRKMV